MGNARILVVDDDEANRRLLRRAYDALTTEPYRHALSGGDAIEELRQDVRRGWRAAGSRRGAGDGKCCTRPARGNRERVGGRGCAA